MPYGSDSSQYADLHLPGGRRRPGTVVIIHGGFWRAAYTADLGTPLAADLAGRGWVAWNLEYRRLGDGGGGPATFLDVATGVDKLAEVARGGDHGPIDTSAVVAIGHSAGGQLAAWLAGRASTTARSSDPSLPLAVPRVDLTGVVSQAGVLDLTVAGRSGLGGTAVPDLLGGTAAKVPERYRTADPIRRLPIGATVHCVHSKDDTTVPYAQSAAYVDAATEAGDRAVLHPVQGDHLTLIDPSSAAWATVVALLPDLLGRRGTRPDHVSRGRSGVHRLSHGCPGGQGTKPEVRAI
ncbi:alpha/beta hydrolase [Intrasporangium sp.]|uniref:alpha/beta hydrolase family protein n=1 Tax=Intrasporangium sp. TaxID=1925024 RepID=UPI003221DB03